MRLPRKGIFCPILENVWENANFQNVISHDTYMLAILLIFESDIQNIYPNRF